MASTETPFTMSSPTTAARTGGASSSNILSTKVQRALQVRTDTPAMTNALASLATIHSTLHKDKKNSNNAAGSSNSSSHSKSNKNNNIIDARNVRNAIEEDALYQAKLLEQELSNLVDMVGNMRGSIKDVLNVAERVGQGLESGVMDIDTTTSTSTSTTEESKLIENDIHNNNINDASSASLFEKERQLASLLADAFQEREEATLRYETITEFLEKYDLDEEDSNLLDYYNFEHVFDSSDRGTGTGSSNDNVNANANANMNDNSGGSNEKKNVRFASTSTEADHEEKNGNDGMAFLDALQRVTKIKNELTTSFNLDDSNNNNNNNSKNNKNTKKDDKKSYLGMTSAIRMVDNLASKQEKAFERLYHFLHNHLDLKMSHVPTSSSGIGSSMSKRMNSHDKKSSNTDDDDDVDGMDETLNHPFIQKALIVLRHIPAYYTHTLELIATSRRSEVTRKFLLALTSGYNGMSPIEMKAHDPVNYVGDMLAFVFRTISVESELAKGLVITVDGDDDANDADADDGSDEADPDESNNDTFGTTFMSASDVLNDTLSGVARPLKSRITQVIASLARRPEEEEDFNRLDGLNEHGFADEEADTARIRLAFLYSICGLILFYRSAMAKAVNKLGMKTPSSRNGGIDELSFSPTTSHSNPLVQCLSECLEDAAKAYAASLKVYCAMLDHLASISNESQANLCQTVILRLCAVRSNSPGFGPDFDKDVVGISEAASNALSLNFLCDTVIEAILPSCNNIDDIVTIKTALTGAKKAGLSSESASKWRDTIMKLEEKMLDAQIVMDTNYVLDECGLGSIASALEGMKAVYIEGMVISSHPGLSQQSLQDAMGKFYASLIELPFPSYDNIKDPVLRKRSKTKITESVCEMYEEIYNMLTSEKGGYSDLSFLKHSPDQVRVLTKS